MFIFPFSAARVREKKTWKMGLPLSWWRTKDMLLGCLFFSLSFIVGYETRIPGYEFTSFLFMLVVCCELITQSLRILGTRLKGLTAYLTEQFYSFTFQMPLLNFSPVSCVKRFYELVPQLYKKVYLQVCE